MGDKLLAAISGFGLLITSWLQLWMMYEGNEDKATFLSVWAVFFLIMFYRSVDSYRKADEDRIRSERRRIGIFDGDDMDEFDRRDGFPRR